MAMIYMLYLQKKFFNKHIQKVDNTFILKTKKFANVPNNIAGLK